MRARHESSRDFARQCGACAKDGERFLVANLLRGPAALAVGPLRKGHVLSHMMTGCRVLVSGLRKPWSIKEVRHADERRPHATMNERDLACNEAADKHIRRFAQGSQDAKDFFAASMCPPAAHYGLADNDFDQSSGRAPRRYQHNALLLDVIPGVLQADHEHLSELRT